MNIEHDGEALALRLTMAGGNHELALTSSSAEPESILARAQAGDLAAFEQLMRLYERQIWRTSLRLLFTRDDAPDAAQEVFLRLHKHLGRLESSQSIFPWIYRVTVNVCHDINRRRGREPRISLDETVSGFTSYEAADPGPSPYQQAASGQESRVMAEALRDLTAKERAAVVLRDVEGFSTREAAGMLGVSEATVRSHICHARLKLRAFRDRKMGGRR
jgi:RNA polymerase sigma-70 factor (ECF subfamily)